MPRIPRSALECVAYLYATREDAERGEQTGGTGFVVGVSPGASGWIGWSAPWPMPWLSQGTGDPNEHFLYVVTAGHLIFPGEMPVVRLTTRDSGTRILDLPLESWVRHPAGDDVAACPLGLVGEHPGTPFIPETAFVTKEAVEAESVGVGDEAFFVGRFISHDGRQQNEPTARFGNISMLPGIPVRHSEFRIDQESFLVEMRSLSGYSGSPVFVYSSRISLRETMKAAEARREAKRAITPRHSRAPTLNQQIDATYEPLFHVHFLGVDWAHLTGKQRVRDENGDELANRSHVKENSGMMAVVPAWKLSELLHDEEQVSPG